MALNPSPPPKRQLNYSIGGGKRQHITRKETVKELLERFKEDEGFLRKEQMEADALEKSELNN